MNPWAFWSTVHYLWLVFQEQPLVVYLDGPGLYGAGIPFAVSLLILWWIFSGAERFQQRVWTYLPKWLWIYRTTRQSSPISLNLPILSGFFLTCVVIGHYSGYWTQIGYHFFDAGLIFWPMLALLDGEFPVLLTYPLTFFGMLIDDVFAAGQQGHWAGTYWFGVGGAGFHDGLFIGPITALTLAVLLKGLGALGRREGLFSSEPQRETNPEEPHSAL
ncbi:MULTISPECIES: hypothetical protein [Acidithiobacillus]|jgi:hypothetical protein|uniref:Uncharacterized protein n=2 Tax=Acidithiobacillus thiooxidans TaxID=930 RepID=A0A5P9XQB2_ACITH|nr:MULTISPECIES: hypothetical protein [Acidithiobacillus]MDD2750071.1 hypothetical protein [Acidithiobacillus sp.]MDD5280185.1 hypothetical protein [Acidithiobacillus sp.]QFX95968.1 hypothetical protein GCD22_01672 [Acidithiobacillus thiooxidans ATCC 19377]